MRAWRAGCRIGAALAVVGLSVGLEAAARDTRVADAARDGRRDAVRALLKEGADVNAAHADGMTALHYAALAGDADLATLLVYAGANVKATTRLGAYTPLHLASRQGQRDVVEVLLRAGADPNAPTASGATPLMLAAAAGDPHLVARLLDAGADPNAREQFLGETALMFAAAAGRTEVVALLAARGADLGAATKVVDVSKLALEGEDGGQQQQQSGQQGQGAGGGQAAGAQRGAEAGRAAAAPAGASPAGRAPAGERPRRPPVPGVDRQYRYNELVGKTGGLAPIHFAARHGYLDVVQALVAAGADVNQRTGSDGSSPLLVAIINGHYDLAMWLLEHGADPRLAADNGVTPLYAVLNCQWAPKALYPQPRAYEQQQTSYLDLMKALLERGADPNARLKRKVWYSGYNFDLSGVDEIGATPFWRAAYASDVEAMRLLVAYGADPNIPTIKPAARPRTGDGQREVKDVSGLPPIPVGGPGVPPLLAAAGVGYGEGFAANSHRNHPAGWMPAVKYLIEELGADVNARDHEGNTALHHAAARGDNEMIEYLIAKGADLHAVNREGRNVADMANSPVQRIEPFPETLALLEKYGVRHTNKCVSCGQAQ
jgi:ankyrin repeat protein